MTTKKSALPSGHFDDADVDREAIVSWARGKFDPGPQVDRYVEILESSSEDDPPNPGGTDGAEAYRSITG